MRVPPRSAADSKRPPPASSTKLIKWGSNTPPQTVQKKGAATSGKRSADTTNYSSAPSADVNDGDEPWDAVPDKETCKALWEFKGAHAGDLKFPRGAVITILTKVSQCVSSVLSTIAVCVTALRS